ncbi:MAG: elongation factor Ts [Legionellales bacterium]|nr:elongation factor Ts [Legionellales bacterium]
MSKVSAKDVALLRKATGVGFSDCKAALEEKNGDIEEAKIFLRKKGLANAEKKGGRVAAEGIIGIQITEDFKKAVMIEQNCETDFVAKNNDFVAFVNKLASAALNNDIQDADKLMSEGDFESQRQQLVLTLGENIQVRRISHMAAEGEVVHYQHGTKIGVIVDVEGSKEVGKDIAMHIAASNPTALSIDKLPEDIVNREKDICLAQTKALNKPAEFIEKIMEGKLNKMLGEMCLLNQPFIKDPSKSVQQYLKESGSTVHQFVRFEVGEGIEKKQENFAEEVKKQLGD